MADNTTFQTTALATPPSGLVVATDQIGGVDYQRVKGTWGPDGTATDVDAGASALPIQDGGNSLTVDAPVGTPAFVRLSDGAAAITTLAVSLASVPSHAVTNAGTFAVQATSYEARTRISVTPTVSTSPAYTAKDAVGGLLTFANAARNSGGTIVIDTAVVIDNGQQMPALELVLFNQTFTASSDNAIFNPSDGDLANAIGVIALSNWSDFSGNSIATRTGLGLAAALTGTSLFGQLVTRGTPTFVATSDITVILTIKQD